MPTYLIDTHGNSRLAYEDWSNQTADNGSYTGHSTSQRFILCIQIGYDIMVACNKAPNAAQVKLQWQRDALGWNDVAVDSEIAWDTDASGITDDATGTLRIATSPSGCSGSGTARENENDNTLPDSGTLSIAGEDWIEAQWALDPALAVAGGVYSFQVVNITSGNNALANSIASTVTIESETTTSSTSSTTTSSTTTSSSTTSSSSTSSTCSTISTTSSTASTTSSTSSTCSTISTTSSTESSTSSTMTTTTTQPYGTVVWGHDSAVVEVYIRDFTGQWTGDGSISGSGDDEVLVIGAGEYMESPIWYYGPGSCRITLNKYQNGDNVTIKYKDGATYAACDGDTWHDYVGSFMSSNFVKVRLEG